MAKKHYRVRSNWSHYNESLVQRGSVTIWFDNESLNQWYETGLSKGQGRPQVYSDAPLFAV